MSSSDRQRIERVKGSRRAKLTPAPGTDPSPEAPVPGRGNAVDDEDEGARRVSGPDDERLTREKPPHWR